MYIKKLIEKRNALSGELETMLNTCETETRAFNEAEQNRYGEIIAEIRSIDTTLDAAENAQEMNETERRSASNPKGQRSQEELEERAFECYIRGIVPEEEVRSVQNMTTGDNAAIIPTTIANRIISRVHDISPLYDRAEHFNVPGNLPIPAYDDENQRITMAYADEFAALQSSSGKFKSVELKGFVAGALTKVSRSLIKNSKFDIVPFVIKEMAEAIALWLDDQMINGKPSKIDGLSKLVPAVTTAAPTAVTLDEIIDLQEEVPDRYQNNAIWIMNKTTRKALRKIKDKDGNYILNKDATAKWEYTMFGHDVYTSDAVKTMTSGARAIIYGDPSGLAVKVSEDMSIEVLREKYADEHAVGIIAWMELDAKVQDEQKLVVLEMHA